MSIGCKEEPTNNYDNPKTRDTHFKGFISKIQDGKMALAAHEGEMLSRLGFSDDTSMIAISYYRWYENLLVQFNNSGGDTLVNRVIGNVELDGKRTEILNELNQQVGKTYPNPAE